MPHGKLNHRKPQNRNTKHSFLYNAYCRMPQISTIFPFLSLSVILTKLFFLTKICLVGFFNLPYFVGELPKVGKLFSKYLCSLPTFSQIFPKCQQGNLISFSVNAEKYGYRRTWLHSGLPKEFDGGEGLSCLPFDIKIKYIVKRKWKLFSCTVSTFMSFFLICQEYWKLCRADYRQGSSVSQCFQKNWQW